MNRLDKTSSLIEGYLGNTCTRDEFLKAIGMLKDPFHNLILRSVLYKRWSDPEFRYPELSEEEKKDIRYSLSEIHHMINISGGNWKSKSGFERFADIVVKIAAALLLPVMVISLWYFFASRNPYKSTESFITINTPNGSKIKTELPDGTIVWQNSGSTVKYPRDFTKRNRQVILTGEAFLDVKSDKLHPFHVTAGNLLIEVTGTRFNVTGYENEETSYVVLESGNLTVKNLNSGPSRAITLCPGDRLVSSGEKGMTINHKVDVKKYISWIDGKLIFRNDPLEEILKKLSRWYNVDIVVNDPEGSFRNLPFTMTIEYESLPQILEYLKHAAPLSVKEEKLALQDDKSFSRQRYVIQKRK